MSHELRPSQDSESNRLRPRGRRRWVWFAFQMLFIGLFALLSQFPATAGKLEQLQRSDPKLYGLVVMGLLAGTVIGLANEMNRWRSIDREEKLTNERDVLRLKHKRERDAALDLAREKATVEQERDKANHFLEVAEKQIAAVENCDGHHWLVHSHKREPFIPLHERQREFRSKTQIVSFINFKGGVGKTTLCANLGHIFATQGIRVLFVDLDFQGTLSRLCADERTLQDTERGGQTSENLLVHTERSPDELKALVKRLAKSYAHHDGENNHIIIAREELAAAEFREEVRWLIRSTLEKPSYDLDPRYRLRRAFHSPYVFQRYDLVLLDCPPRQTASSVNAVACSDHVVMPVQIDQNAGDALPRTIYWLEALKSIAPNIQQRLVVANMSRLRVGQLIRTHDDNYQQLADLLRPFSGVELLKNTIVFDTDIAKLSLARQPVAVESDLFNGVAEELATKIGLTWKCVTS